MAWSENPPITDAREDKGTEITRIRPNQLSDLDRALETAIMELLSRRGPGKTICPSEAARFVDPNGWEALMDKARAAARRLLAQGAIVITQRGKAVDPSRIKGPIRLKIR